MRNTFLNTLVEMAKTDDRIWLITPDLGYGVLEPFRDLFPNRFINAGIAEQNAVGMAAGLAMSGKIPYVYSIMPFVTSRPFEQVKVDCAYMNTNVRLVGVGAGFSYGPAGATHHSIDDLAIMRTLPNMAVVAPGALNEASALTKYSVNHNGPMYIRLNKRGEPTYDYAVEFGKFSRVFDGDAFAVIATSNMLGDAYDTVARYREHGVNAALFSAHTIKPFDVECVLNLVQHNIPIITVEEHNIIGGLYSAVAEVVARSGVAARILPIAVPDKFSHFVGDQNYIREKMGLGHLHEQIDGFMKC